MLIILFCVVKRNTPYMYNCAEIHEFNIGLNLVQLFFVLSTDYTSNGFVF